MSAIQERVERWTAQASCEVRLEALERKCALLNSKLFEVRRRNKRKQREATAQRRRAEYWKARALRKGL